MHELPHTVVILLPTEKMLAWVNGGGGGITLSDVQREPTAILIPEFESAEESDAFLKQHWREIFETELEAWSTPDEWPENLSYELFRSFFRFQFSSMVYSVGGFSDDQPS